MNTLLKKVTHGGATWQAANGRVYYIADVTGSDSFYIGAAGDDFEKEVESTRKNKKLVAYLKDRPTNDKTRNVSANGASSLTYPIRKTPLKTAKSTRKKTGRS